MFDCSLRWHLCFFAAFDSFDALDCLTFICLYDDDDIDGWKVEQMSICGKVRRFSLLAKCRRRKARHEKFPVRSLSSRSTLLYYIYVKAWIFLRGRFVHFSGPWRVFFQGLGQFPKYAGDSFVFCYHPTQRAV